MSTSATQTARAPWPEGHAAAIPARPRVAVLRHQLFKPSEVFISDQARSLTRFSPVLIGRELHGSAASGLDYWTPNAARRVDVLRYMVFRDPDLLLRGAREFHPVLVHAHFGVEAVYGLKLAEELGVPLVTTFHGYDVTMRTGSLVAARKLSWINYVLHRMQLARRGHLFLCVSKFVLQRAQELGFPPDRTRLHYIGIDTEAFSPGTRSDDRPVVLHIARLVEKKGTAHLVRAFAKISARHPHARLVVIGDGPLRERLINLGETLGIAQRVQWLGSRPHTDVKQWLQRASVFCLPSCTASDGDAEGLGMVLLEASASGVPVIGTHHGGIPEAVVHGETGYLVPERDADRLAEGLDTLLSSDTLRHRFGDRGIQHMRESFSLRKQSELLERFYESTLR